MSLPKTLIRTERQRVAALLRYARREGWEPAWAGDGAGSWRNRRLGKHIDYEVTADHAFVRVLGVDHERIGSALVHSVGQAVDFLAACRLVPARYSNLYVAGAMTVAERLVESVTSGSPL